MHPDMGLSYEIFISLSYYLLFIYLFSSERKPIEYKFIVVKITFLLRGLKETAPCRVKILNYSYPR